MTQTEGQEGFDHQFQSFQYRLSEIEHHYGKNVHVLANPFLLSHLARLCSADTTQPWVNELVTTIYQSMLQTIVNQEFATCRADVKTRMYMDHPEAIFRGPVIDQNIPAVSVNLARAGTLPSHLCYTALNYFMNPHLVRQDHISIGRTTNDDSQVTGSHISGHKIGGDVDGAYVLFPDPMGATGSTLCEALSIYKQRGKAKKYIALHCIVTPEYLKRVTKEHPDLIVYTIRVDRGLSPPEILKTKLGSRWSEERGLNDKHYIVPGGGGFGEVLNNAYV
jgi:uracil phosphoribosyltransferase